MTQMTDAGNIKKKIEIPSDIKYIEKVREEILGHLERFKVEESIQFDIRLAIEEAVRNAIEHGNPPNKGLSVVVSYCVDKDKIEVTVEDQGEGFDFKKVPDPRTEDNIMKGGGRGVFLIHKLMDKVTYNKKGNIITITKFFK